MKNVFEFIRRRLRLFVLAWVALMVATLAARLSQGPIRVDWARPVIESRFSAQLPHTRATIKHLDLVWFADARAIGFRFEDLIITDRNHRIIARAGKMETALAADSLLLLHFAPARLSAEDFFVAASVSREGRYDLGFDAHGLPGSAAGLDRFFYDLVGPEQLGEPVSFTRQILLKNGELRFTQEGAPLDWTAHVSNIDFTKLRGQFAAHADLVVQSEGMTGGHVARLKASASGTVGLKKATISADVRGLYPSHIFPSIGASKFLAGINAPLDGLARVDYVRKEGFQGAWFDLGAGQGRVDVGDFHQTFDSARVRARYTSADHTAVFQTFRLKSHLFDGVLSGRVQMVPHDDQLKRDLTLNFDFSGAHVTGRLADDFALQTLTNARFHGSYIPKLRRLRYDRVSGLLNGAPLESQGTLFTNDQGQLGADLTARIKGRFTKEEVFAFWPQDLAEGTRKMLIERIVGGDFANANFVLKAPAGHFERDSLTNADLRLDFDYQNLELAIENRLHHAVALKGHGTLLGDSFAMDVTGGRLDNVELSRGRLSVPAFHGRSYAHIDMDSTAQVPDIIEAIDPVTNNQLQPHGLNRARLSGTAVSHVEIEFPTFEAITNKNFSLVFQSKVSQAAFKQAALGWDMTNGALQVDGDLLANRLVVAGPAQLGPYAGDVTYQTQMEPKSQIVDFKGHFNAAQFGGSPNVPVAIKGHFTIASRTGQGTVESNIFRGNVTWSGDTTGAEERPTRMSITGDIRSDGMEDQGLPIFEHLPRDLPTRISLVRSGDIWSGELDAEAIAGDIAYVQGSRPRLVYKSTITPEDAQILGYGALPVFSVPRRLTVNISLDGVTKTALLRLDNINATLGWQEVPGSDDVKRRVDMRLTPDDWYALGLPRSFFAPEPLTEVSAIWQQTDTLLSGQVLLLDQTIDFDMPLHRRSDPNPISLPNTSMPYALQVRGKATPRLLKALGYSDDPVHIRGTSDLVFSLYNTPGQPAAVVNIDATQAQLGVKATDWIKPAGEAATLAFSFDDQGGASKGLNVSRIYGKGPRIGIDGRAAFSSKGDLQFADFSKVYLKDFIDVAYRFFVVPDQVNGTQNARNVLAISGHQLDLRPWLDSTSPPSQDSVTAAQAVTALAQGKSPAVGQPTRFVVNVDSLRLTSGPAFGRLALDLNWDGRNAWEGTGSAQTADGSPVTLISRAKGAYSLFSVQATNLGNAIETATGNATIKGGVGTIEGAYADGNADATISGRYVRVQRIPALAQLLTVASLQGLNDTLAGDGILFSDFELPIRYRGHSLFIKDGYVKGPALGINIWGTSDLESKRLDFTGTLIPAYSVNSIFGDVKSNGLGLVGIKYDLRGPYTAPEVAVNPLSIVLPGFLKAWFNSQRVDPYPALTLPAYKDDLEALRDGKKK